MPRSGGSMTTSNKRDLNGKTVVIKIGGSTLGEGDSTVPDIVELWKQGAKPVVVHGGGKVISDWVGKQGIHPEFIRGLRRTDSATLEVAVAVLAGLVNSQLVAEFQANGANAIGISGVSGGLLQPVLRAESHELRYGARVVDGQPHGIAGERAAAG